MRERESCGAGPLIRLLAHRRAAAQLCAAARILARSTIRSQRDRKHVLTTKLRNRTPNTAHQENGGRGCARGCTRRTRGGCAAPRAHWRAPPPPRAAAGRRCDQRPGSNHGRSWSNHGRIMADKWSNQIMVESCRYGSDHGRCWSNSGQRCRLDPSPAAESGLESRAAFFRGRRSFLHGPRSPVTVIGIAAGVIKAYKGPCNYKGLLRSV